MLIKSVKFKNHKFFRNKEIKLINNKGEGKTHYIFKLDEQSPTHFTIIVGENGSGKTRLKQNIVSSFYLKKGPRSLQSGDSASQLLKHIQEFNEGFLQPSSEWQAKGCGTLIVDVNNSVLDPSISYENQHHHLYNLMSENTTESLIRFLQQDEEKQLTKKLGEILKLSIIKSAVTVTIRYRGDEGNKPFYSQNGLIFRLQQTFIPFSDPKRTRAQITTNLKEIVELIEENPSFNSTKWHEPLMQHLLREFNKQFDPEITGQAISFPVVREGVVFQKFKSFFEEIRFPEEYNTGLWDEHSGGVPIMQTHNSIDFSFNPKELTDADIWLLRILKESELIRTDISLNQEDTLYSTLSSGQKNIVRIFSIFADVAHKERSIKDAIIFIDEPENTLHPKWEMVYLANLETILAAIGFERAHVIITTHSVFIAQAALETKTETSLVRFKFSENKDFSSSFVTQEDKTAYTDYPNILADVFETGERPDQVTDALMQVLLSETNSQNNIQTLDSWLKIKPTDRIFAPMKATEYREKLKKLKDEFLKPKS